MWLIYNVMCIKNNLKDYLLKKKENMKKEKLSIFYGFW